MMFFREICRKNIGILFCFALITSCSSFSNVQVVPDVQTLFEKENMHGGFMLLDNTAGTFYLSNVHEDTTKRISGGSAAMLLSLVALEERVIANEKVVWNTQKRKEHMTLLQLLVEPQQPQIAKLQNLIPTEKLHFWKDSLQYGLVEDKKKPAVTYQISVDEQLGLVKRLFFNQLPFASRTNRIIKNSIPSIKFNQQEIKLFQAAHTHSDTISVWNIGWIKHYKKIYLFSTFAQSTKDSQELALKKTRHITLQALENLIPLPN